MAQSVQRLHSSPGVLLFSTLFFPVLALPRVVGFLSFNYGRLTTSVQCELPSFDFTCLLTSRGEKFRCSKCDFAFLALISYCIYLGPGDIICWMIVNFYVRVIHFNVVWKRHLFVSFFFKKEEFSEFSAPVFIHIVYSNLINAKLFTLI